MLHWCLNSATLYGCAIHVNNIYYYTQQDYLSRFHVMVHNHTVISKAGIVDVLFLIRDITSRYVQCHDDYAPMHQKYIFSYIYIQIQMTQRKLTNTDNLLHNFSFMRSFFC